MENSSSIVEMNSSYLNNNFTKRSQFQQQLQDQFDQVQNQELQQLEQKKGKQLVSYSSPDIKNKKDLKEFSVQVSDSSKRVEVMNFSASFKLSGNSFQENSIQDEILLWEKCFETEREVYANLEDNFKFLSENQKLLNENSDFCLKECQKRVQGGENLMKLLRGLSFLKFSRKNQKNSHMRVFFYSPNLDSFCWRDPKFRFPKENQTIALNQIRSIEFYNKEGIQKKKQGIFQEQTNLFNNLQIPLGFSIQNWICINQLNGEKLELIADSEQNRDLFKQIWEQDLGVKKCEDEQKGRIQIQSISVEEGIKKSKQMMIEVLNKQNRNFFETSIKLLKQERKRTKELRKSAKQVVQREIDYEKILNENIRLKNDVILMEKELDFQIQKWKNLNSSEDQLMNLIQELRNFLEINQISTPKNQQIFSRELLLQQAIQDIQQIMQLFEKQNEYLKSIQYTNQNENENKFLLNRNLIEYQQKHSELLEQINSLINEKKQQIFTINDLENQNIILQRMNDQLIDKLESFYEQLENRENKIINLMQNSNPFENNQNSMKIEQLEKELQELNQNLNQIQLEKQRLEQNLFDKEIEILKIKNQNDFQQHSKLSKQNASINFLNINEKENIQPNLEKNTQENQNLINQNLELERLNQNLINRFKELETKITQFEKLFQEKKLKFEEINKKYQTCKQIQKFYKRNLDDIEPYLGNLFSWFIILILGDHDKEIYQMPLQLVFQKAQQVLNQSIQSNNGSDLFDSVKKLFEILTKGDTIFNLNQTIEKNLQNWIGKLQFPKPSQISPLSNSHSNINKTTLSSVGKSEISEKISFLGGNTKNSFKNSSPELSVLHQFLNPNSSTPKYQGTNLFPKHRKTNSLVSPFNTISLKNNSNENFSIPKKTPIYDIKNRDKSPGFKFNTQLIKQK